MRQTPLRRKSPLRARSRLSRLGRRGKRLLSADRWQERETHALACVCGCSAGPGEVARAHLERRGIESTRNEAANNLPACWWLGEWLDHTPEGANCKRSLWALAICLGRRLEHEDVHSLLELYGYYEWRKRLGG